MTKPKDPADRRLPQAPWISSGGDQPVEHQTAVSRLLRQRLVERGEEFVIAGSRRDGAFVETREERQRVPWTRDGGLDQRLHELFDSSTICHVTNSIVNTVIRRDDIQHVYERIRPHVRVTPTVAVAGSDFDLGPAAGDIQARTACNMPARSRPAARLPTC